MVGHPTSIAVARPAPSNGARIGSAVGVRTSPLAEPAGERPAPADRAQPALGGRPDPLRRDDQQLVVPFQTQRRRDVDRAALPPLGEGEYYHGDLIGLPCVGQDGSALGKVAAVENFGAGDLLEIEKPDGRKSLIPFTPGVADLDGERIVLDPEFLA